MPREGLSDATFKLRTEEKFRQRKECVKGLGTKGPGILGSYGRAWVGFQPGRGELLGQGARH